MKVRTIAQFTDKITGAKIIPGTVMNVEDDRGKYMIGISRVAVLVEETKIDLPDPTPKSEDVKTTKIKTERVRTTKIGRSKKK